MLSLLQINVVSDSASLAASEVIDAATSSEINLLDLALKGGIIMIPIVILSFIAIYIFIERYLAIMKAQKEDYGFMDNIKTKIMDGNIAEAMALCKANDTPVARMIEKGISRIGRPLTDVSAAIENVGKLEVYKLEKGLPTVATVSGAAPMIGFLGTVMGMIQAFHNMANAAGGNLNVQLLSGGIYTAMVTTVAGLVVGVIAYLAYNILVAKVEKVVNLLELRTTQFMDLLNEPVS